MAPRGLSSEEKRFRLLEIFHETVCEEASRVYPSSTFIALQKDFFQLKELEKLGPKMKGIVSQSVKDVLASLVDDGLVCTDKIGSSNFFWSFPSQKGTIVQAKLLTHDETRRNSQCHVSELLKAIEAEKSTRADSDHRTQSLSRLTTLEEELRELGQELANYGDCDPARFAEMKRAGLLAKEAALRWTDNYSILLGFFTRQSGTNAADIRKYLGIEEDYEDNLC